MARKIDADFEQLKQFLDGYQLVDIGKSPEQLSIVKAAHKAYLPFLQFWAICSDKAVKKSFGIFNRPIRSADLELAYLRESVSDVGTGFFCCLHGAYKPGQMALRSSIENFLRFAAGPFDSRALKTTSVYELFKIARRTEPFTGKKMPHIHQLHTSYVELCKYSHSASLGHMVGIHALKHFPSFEEKAFQGWLSHAKPCMSAMVTVTSLGNPSIYLDAHYSAKELLDQLIPQTERLHLLGGR